MIKETFKTYDEALQFIRDYESDNGYKFIVMAIASGFTDKLLNERIMDCPLLKRFKPKESNFSKKELTSMFHRKVLYGREDLPYLHISNGKMTMLCGLGGRKYPDRNRSKSSTALVNEPSKRTYTRKKRKEGDPCPVEIRVLSLVYFPEYKISEEVGKQQTSRMVNHLRKHFNAETCIPHYIVEIDENHSNHSKPKVIVNQQTVQFIQDLVQRGYYSAATITDQLDVFYKNLSVKPDKNDLRFYPPADKIRKLVFPQVNKQRNLEREKGFTHNYEEARQRMRDFEKDTFTCYQCRESDGRFGQHDVYEAARTNSVVTSKHNELRCRIDTGGVPYMILSTQYYECSHGIDYRNKYVDPFTTGQRKHLDREGNVMCTARCTLIEVALFPSYMNDSITQRNVRELILARLQQDLQDRTAAYERVFAYSFPCIDEHCGHPCKEVQGRLFLDDTIKCQIGELVSEGVRSLAEMRRHLKMYLKHQFDELSMPGPFNKKYRPSTQTIVNVMCDHGITVEDIILDVSDPVYYFSESSDSQQIKKDPRQPANTDTGSVPQSPYDELVKSLEVLQSENNKESTITYQTTADTDTEPKQKSDGTGTFSDIVFRKQSECQTLLEEILQTVYQLTDMFRLRDLHELLKRVNEGLKEGKMLCDEIAVKRDGEMGKRNEENRETGTSKEISMDIYEICQDSPTNLVTTVDSEPTTEVELSEKSTGMVVYQGNNELGEQYIVVEENCAVPQTTAQADLKGLVSASVEKRGNTCTSIAVEGRKELIKIQCRDSFTKEDIFTRLNITEHKNVKSENVTDLHVKELSSKGKINDLDVEIRSQEKELLQLEKDKVALTMMELKLNRIGSNCTSGRIQQSKNGNKNRKRHLETKKEKGMCQVKKLYIYHPENSTTAISGTIQDGNYSHVEVQGDVPHTTSTCSREHLNKLYGTVTVGLTDQIGIPTRTEVGQTYPVTANQSLSTGLVAKNNITYTSADQPLIPELATEGIHLVIPNPVSYKQPHTEVNPLCVEITNNESDNINTTCSTSNAPEPVDRRLIEHPYVKALELEQIKEGSITTVKLKPSVRVIRVRRNISTDVNKQYTVAELTVKPETQSGHGSKVTSMTQMSADKNKTPSQSVCLSSSAYTIIEEPRGVSTENKIKSIVNSTEELSEELESVSSQSSIVEDVKGKTPPESESVSGGSCIVEDAKGKTRPESDSMSSECCIVEDAKGKTPPENVMEITPSLTMKTRGRAIRFSRSGEKLS